MNVSGWQTTFVGEGGIIDVDLTPMEGDLLRFLATDAYRVFSHDEIYEGVWGYVPVISYSLQVAVCTLRRKLRGAGITQVVTHRGRGYSLRRRD